MKKIRITRMLVVALVLSVVCCVPAFATGGTGTTGDVASAVQQAWAGASEQIKTVENNVVFPALDMILAVLLFVKIASAYMDYRKHGQMEWAPIAILFAGLIFSLPAPQYIWTILGI